MKRTFWRHAADILSWPIQARESVGLRVVFVAQLLLFVLGLKTAVLGGGWYWGLPVASVAVYVLTDFIIGAFLFINLMNPFNRD
jgi:hypothetical protein